ncbi:MAG: A/G-specific adenine glycosylase [Armatimonadetes bacterium]|nr:A/G-specific adenine glycosylase [Armatimonadota bacterium]
MTPYSAALLEWYRRERRPLPWRGETDPYRIWVSEVMLQQTQVETVKPYYHRFLARFPKLADLARAELLDVLAIWQGLGYYRRARCLHAAAQRVVAEHGGELPREPAVLRRLPGVGEYTAAAVASLAYGVPVAVVDGNVERVVSRWLALPDDPSTGAGRRAVRALLAERLPAAAPGDFNQAMMELGAMICLPASPRCERCPVTAWCRAYAEGEPARYPVRTAAKAPRRRLHICAVIRREGALLLAQRPAEGRWGGLWELPRVELAPEYDPAEGLRAGLRAALGIEVAVGAKLAGLRHAVSGESIELRAHVCDIVSGEPAALGYAAVGWSASPEELPLPTPQRHMLAMLAIQGGS